MSSASCRALAAIALLGALQSPIGAQTVLPLLMANQSLGPARPELADPAPSDMNRAFGQAMAIDGRVALVGMPEFGGTSGRAAVFIRKPSDPALPCAVFASHVEPQCWERAGSLDASDRSPGDSFGKRVALRDDLAMVGARSGIYVFRRDHGHWRQIQKLVAQDYGALALERHWAFISGPIVDAGGPASVFVFRVGPHGRLEYTQELTTEEGVPGVGFGASLAVSDDVLIVGASRRDGSKGAVYVFERDGRHHEMRWVQRQRLTQTGGQSPSGDDDTGFAEAIAIDDRVIAVSAPHEVTPDRTDGCSAVDASGVIHVFVRHWGHWVQQQRLPGPCGAFNFADQVAISGSRMAATLNGGPADFRGTFSYARLGSAFVAAAAIQHDEGGGSVLALSGPSLFIGYPFDRQSEDPDVHVGHTRTFDFRDCRFFGPGPGDSKAVRRLCPP